MRRVYLILSLVTAVSAGAYSQFYWVKSPFNPFLAQTFSPISFDDTYALNPAAIKEDSVYRIWYNGLNSVNLNYTIGHVRSVDGRSYEQRASAPVLDVIPGSQHESNYLRLSCVVKLDSGYRMYYQAITNGVGVLCTAVSPDGIGWTRDTPGPVLLPQGSGWEATSIGTPWVVRVGPTDYRMWYAGSGDEGIVRIGYAISSDGITWNRHPGNPIFDRQPANAWEARMVSAPRVLILETVFHMFYLGVNSSATQRLGYATSSDGINWTRAVSTPVLDLSGGENTLADPAVICDQDSFKCWYTYRSSSTGRWNIGFAATPIKPLGVPETADLPQSINLDAYPNPFNPGSVIRFSLPAAAEVTLDVYDLLGKHVGSLVHERRAAGVHEVQWNAEHLASGAYIAVLNGNGTRQSVRLLLMK